MLSRNRQAPSTNRANSYRSTGIAANRSRRVSTSNSRSLPARSRRARAERTSASKCAGATSPWPFKHSATRLPLAFARSKSTIADASTTIGARRRISGALSARTGRSSQGDDDDVNWGFTEEEQRSEGRSEPLRTAKLYCGGPLAQALRSKSSRAASIASRASSCDTSNGSISPRLSSQASTGTTASSRRSASCATADTLMSASRTR